MGKRRLSILRNGWKWPLPPGCVWRLLVIRREQQPICVCVLQKRLRWTAELCHPLIEDYPVLIIAPEAEAEVWSAVMPGFAGHGGIPPGLIRSLSNCRAWKRLSPQPAHAETTPICAR